MTSASAKAVVSGIDSSVISHAISLESRHRASSLGRREDPVRAPPGPMEGKGEQSRQSQRQVDAVLGAS